MVSSSFNDHQRYMTQCQDQFRNLCKVGWKWKWSNGVGKIVLHSYGSTVNWSLIGSDMPSALGLVLRMTQYPQYSMPVCICKDVISSQSWRCFYKTIVISSELTLAYHRFPFPIPHGGWGAANNWHASADNICVCKDVTIQQWEIKIEVIIALNCFVEL